MSVKNPLQAGAAVADITPRQSVFLFGYPNVPRWSTGVHDPLLASALYVSDGITPALFLAADIIFVGLASTKRIRRKLARITHVPEGNICISATHTHSGPISVDYLSNEHDPVVPKMDAKYVQWFENQMVDAGRRAVESAEPARLGLAVADGTGVGTNRRDPTGPADLDIPVLMAKRAHDDSTLAVMLICNMHPTVLHEDSTLISGDFPGMARRFLQQEVLGAQCPVLYHTGPAGNQSPRHVVQGNTLAEAERLGRLVGTAVARALGSIKFIDHAEIECRRTTIEMPLRTFPSAAEAQQKLDQSIDRLERLRKSAAPRTQIRTAECDWFGAAETRTLAQAAADGRLADYAASCMPAEIQLIRIGQWNFVGWPGEMFVEFSLEVKARHPNTFIISYANGELQGYLVTRQAVDEGGYEASNALFQSPESGDLLVKATLDLLKMATHDSHD